MVVVVVVVVVVAAAVVVVVVVAAAVVAVVAAAVDFVRRGRLVARPRILSQATSGACRADSTGPPRDDFVISQFLVLGVLFRGGLGW